MYTCEELEVNPLLHAIIRQDEHELCRLLEEGQDPNREWVLPRTSPELETWPRPYSRAHINTPLSFALEWEKGTKRLLAAGARPLSAFASFVYPNKRMIGSFQALLDYDLPLSVVSPFSGKTIAEIVFQISLHRQSRMAFAETFVDQRRRLKIRALEVLSESEREHYGLKTEEGELPDTNAAIVSAALFEKGLDIYDANSFFPGHFAVCPVNRPGLTSFHLGVENMTVEVADYLFTSGFHDINAVADPSKSPFPGPPIWKSCCANNFDMVHWFIDKGALLDLEGDGIRVPLITGLAKLVREISRSGVGDFFHNYGRSRFLPNGVSHWVRQWRDSGIVARLVAIDGPNPSDCCKCYCSERGCTPISALRDSLPWQIPLLYPDKMLFMQRWCTLLCTSDTELEQCWRDFFRLETFERLGLAHCCHIWDYHASADQIRRRCDEAEQQELQEEDEKAGLLAELQQWMDAYDVGRSAFRETDGSLDDFAKSWSQSLNRELFENETYRVVCERYPRWMPYRPADYILGKRYKYPSILNHWEEEFKDGWLD